MNAQGLRAARSVKGEELDESRALLFSLHWSQTDLMHNLSFSLNGSDGALEITSPGGLLVARLTPVEQLELVMHITHAHLKLIDHIRANGYAPRPILEPISNPVEPMQSGLFDAAH